jgi:hypothetical protein
MSEPADVSLPLPSSDLLLMDTKTVAVSIVLTDAKTIEAIAYNIAAMAQIQPSMLEPADVSLPLPSSDLLLMDTRTAAMLTVFPDAKTIEAIAYNIVATAQIQPSMSEPADDSLPLPSSDQLLMDTKTAAVSTVLTDAKTIEAIAYNITVTAQIQPSMLESADVSLPLPSSDLLLMNTKMAAMSIVLTDAKMIEAIAYNIAATVQIQPSSMFEFVDGADPATKTAAVPRVVAKPQIQPSSMSEFADGADDHPSAARRPDPSSPSVRGRVRRRKLG